MTYILGHKYNDSHWQDNASLFVPPKTNPRTGKVTDVYSDTQNIISLHKQAKNPEVFVKHYISKYNSPTNPPSWMCVELLTIGEISRLYNALKNNADKKAIAGFFNLHPTVFSSWLHTLVYARNICAHHSRLWNREFAIRPEVLQNPQKKWISMAYNGNNHRTFYFLSIIKYMLIACNPGNHFKSKFISLLEKYPGTPIRFMGIPTDSNGELMDWKNEPLWK